MYLLDTNHCSRIIQGYPSVIGKLGELGNTPVFTCVIVCGELIFMAEKSLHKAENLDLVRRFIRDIRVCAIDNEAADIYGRLKSSLLDHFGPREKTKRRKTETSKLGFGENDLWIAATAKRFDLTVVSADRDFERIREAEYIRVENWLQLQEK
ncbi:PIN domain-containing protein [Desulfonema limicola]|uniref:PIN domain-containing protein n=1 Tax=Desulfonema limicola TaxID=45656 RepID=A0A975GI68_9BACT|nr:type II toxin-antitoxin system VapC family toxin [Desulfonema limicola]QTA82019.1 PIN domain-containing protein [Desulfonema limicola]